jgi:subtilisin-like proprotein convertase family protein
MTNTQTTTKTIHFFRTLAVLVAMLAAMLVASGVALAATSTSFGSSFQIRDNNTASAYPSAVSFNGLSGTVTDVNLTLDGYRHSFPDDVDVLLVGPGGEKKALVMSDVGGGNAVNAKLTLDDEAPTSLPDESQINLDQYKPTQGTNTSSQGDTQGSAVPANFPASAPPGPYAKNLSVFDGIDPNGTWKLYVIDDSLGDSGAVDNNWALQISTANPTPPPDTIAPKVTIIAPPPGATGVSPTANVVAGFSEDMNASTINGSTFKLFRKGSTTKVSATITLEANLDAGGVNIATLDPTNSLKRGVTYKAVVTTGAKDLAGNRLDQNPTLTGLQQKVWTFTVKQ